MADRIEIGVKAGIRDALGEKIRRRIIEHLDIHVDALQTIEVYTIDNDLTREAALTDDELRAAAGGPLSDPVIQEFSINRPLAGRFDWLIEVGFRPGVTDNVGKTAREALGLLWGRKPAAAPSVYTARQDLIIGPIVKMEAEKIATSLLANELIEHYQIIDGRSWDREQGLPPYVPRVTGGNRPHTEEIDLDADDGTLQKISNERVLALNLAELKIIRAYLQADGVRQARAGYGLGRKITDAELECLAQTWSEHCKHKIFNSLITYEDADGHTELIDSLFVSYIKRSTQEIRARRGKDDWCLSVFSDNAGIIKFDDDYNLVFKVETHNSPSALDPYGGALTGIVGVNRDPFGTGLGAKLIFNTDVFCFAPPDYAEPLPPRLLHPRRIYEGVREGVEHGGNKSGIPTVNGCIVFDERYLAKPLVYCGTGGIMPARLHGEPTHG
ncbi:MAG: AIR synthase related protein, partial [Deltaproteobacteria bacterium]|nr:AIR synthase related protein [Deltaproteobacteria bacterium]